MTDFEGLKKALEKSESWEEEWKRVDRDYYSRIEFVIQAHYIKKLIKTGESVIDIGSGSGRYAIELLKRGSKVALTDLSENFLKKAEGEIRKLGLSGGLLEVRQQNALRLDAFGDARFDHALFMGPMFYMETQEERRRALLEAARVVKGGGLIFLTIISNLRFVQEMFYVPNLNFRLVALGNYAGTVGDILNKGLNRPECVKQLIAECGLEAAVVYGTDSAAGMAFDKIDEMVVSEENWRLMLDVLIKMSADPAIIGLSSHTTYVLRKTAT